VSVYLIRSLNVGEVTRACAFGEAHVMSRWPEKVG
jgi:hypothetical protein